MAKITMSFEQGRKALLERMSEKVPGQIQRSVQLNDKEFSELVNGVRQAQDAARRSKLVIG